MRKFGKNTNSTAFNIQNDKSYQILKIAIKDLKENYKVSYDEIFKIIKSETVSKEILIPISIFDDKNLSALEVICKYLKEELDINYSKIALLLNRDSRTIWTTYKNSIKKRKEKLVVKESKFFIPIFIFTDRRSSVLGVIVRYLKDKFNLRYSQIASLMNRDERNIWAVYNKAKKKQK